MAKTSLQDRIRNLQPYFLGFEIKETLYIMRIALPSRWSAYNSEDNLIKVTKSDTNNEWFYYADINEVDLNDIFDLVEDTILTNESVTKKIELMRQRMEELKELFQSETLERLETLQFVFDDTRKPSKRKYVRKKPRVEKIPLASKAVDVQNIQSLTVSETIPTQNIRSNDEPIIVYNNEDIDNIDL